MADYGPGCPWPYSGNPLLQRVCASDGGGDIPADVEQRLAALEAVTATQAGQIGQLTQENATQAGQITALQQENATQAGQITAAQSAIDVLEATTATQAGQITAAQEAIDALEATSATQAGQISDLETRVAALEAQQPGVEQEAIYIWDGTTYDVPAEPVDGVILRSFYGPTPYTGATWPGVLDEYTFAETVA